MCQKAFFRAKSNDSGLTLVELLVSLAIMGALVGIIIMSIMVMDTTTGKGRNSIYAISQVRNAQLWIQRDGKMARTININTASPSGLPLTLTWTEWGGTRHAVNYYVEDNYLMRSYTEATSSGSEVAKAKTLIADSILPGSPYTTCQYGIDEQAGEFIFTLTASVGRGKYEGTAKRVFEIRPRPGS